jgi:hypothetical protein
VLSIAYGMPLPVVEGTMRTTGRSGPTEFVEKRQGLEGDGLEGDGPAD